MAARAGQEVSGRRWAEMADEALGFSRGADIKSMFPSLALLTFHPSCLSLLAAARCLHSAESCFLAPQPVLRDDSGCLASSCLSCHAQLCPPHRIGACLPWLLLPTQGGPAQMCAGEPHHWSSVPDTVWAALVPICCLGKVCVGVCIAVSLAHVWAVKEQVRVPCSSPVVNKVCLPDRGRVRVEGRNRAGWWQW